MKRKSNPIGKWTVNDDKNALHNPIQINKKEIFIQIESFNSASDCPMIIHDLS